MAAHPGCGTRVRRLSCRLPSTYARQYGFAGALQFAVFAVLTPALLGIGMPGRAARTSRRLARRADAGHAAAARPGGRVAVASVHGAGHHLAAARVLDALARYPALAGGGAGHARRRGPGTVAGDRGPDRTRAAAPPAARRHGRRRHVDDLDHRLHHRHVRRDPDPPHRGGSASPSVPPRTGRSRPPCCGQSRRSASRRSSTTCWSPGSATATSKTTANLALTGRGTGPDWAAARHAAGATAAATDGLGESDERRAPAGACLRAVRRQ